MPMKEGYGKPSDGESLKDNSKLLTDLGKESHKGLSNIPEIR